MHLRQLSLIAVTVVSLCPLAGTCDARGVKSPPRGSFPAFSWKHVPVWADLCAPTGFSPSETKFLATHFSGINIEGTQGLDGNPPRFNVEVNDQAAARELKKYNARLKVLMYSNVQVYLANIYKADRTVKKSWLIQPADGKGNVLFRQGNKKFQSWWIKFAAGAVAGGPIDGLFLDGASCYPKVNPATMAMMRGLRRRLNILEKPTLILYNGVRIGGISPSVTLAYMKYADGGMMEHFDFHPSIDPNGASPQKLAGEMKFIMRLGRMGKIVIVKGWPDFYWIDADINSIPYSTLKRRAVQQITFPLACFLVCAQKYAYFSYSWGYTDTQGDMLLKSDMKTVDPRWYPDLEKPLGRPLDEPIIHGYHWTRRFEHATVSVNLGKHSAKIVWH